MKQNLRTIVQATMNNVLPRTTAVKDRGTMINFFNNLDSFYNFTHGLTPLMIALSNSDQLEELTNLRLPFIDSHIDIINQCLNQSGCEHMIGPVMEKTGSITKLVSAKY